MDVVPILSTIIVISTLVTMVLAIVSLVAYKARERRRPWSDAARNVRPAFFRKYVPDDTDRTQPDLH